jgi:hypothetical protein
VATAFGVAVAVFLDEGLHLFLGSLRGLGLEDLVEMLLGARLDSLRKLVEDVGRAMHPAALLGRLQPDFTQGLPKAQRALADRESRRFEATAVQSTKHGEPALRALAIAVFDGHPLLLAVLAGADPHERAQSVLFEANAQVHTVREEVYAYRLPSRLRLRNCS